MLEKCSVELAETFYTAFAKIFDQIETRNMFKLPFNTNVLKSLYWRISCVLEYFMFGRIFFDVLVNI